MWNFSALILVSATFGGIFLFSLVLATRETMYEVRMVYDRRVLRRSGRSLSRYSIASLMGLTAYTAAMTPLFLWLDTLVAFILLVTISIALTLIRIFVITLFDRRSPKNELPETLPAINLLDNGSSDYRRSNARIPPSY